MDMDSKMEEIKQDIENNKVVLFMKGNELMPMCGFSARSVQILNALGTTFVTRNVLEDQVLREAIKVYSDWPTIPQLYVNGEFVGGSDIMLELYQNGDLQEMLAAADSA
jgi:monothiol glutaredoxin